MKKVPLTLGELLTSILSDYNIKYYNPISRSACS